MSDISKSKKINNNEPKANAWALLPVLVFIFIYVCLNIVVFSVPGLQEEIKEVPLVPAFLVALVFALQQNRKRPLLDRIKTAGSGVGNSSIVLMIIIFILAGAFAGTIGKASAGSVAYFLLSLFPSKYSVLVIFVVACLVSLAMGTSVGSITLITPIAISVAQTSGQDITLCVACTICGSMFGDNLSMISDTAIAACTGLGCKPREKFVENLKLVLPAAIVTCIIIFCLTSNTGTQDMIIEQYNMIEFIPYIIVLVLSIFGVNVLIVLGIGIIAGLIILFIEGQTDVVLMLNNMSTGIQGMYEIIFITILVAAIAALIRQNGGFASVLNIITKLCKSKKNAQLATGILVSLMDLITANNTVAIVISTPIAKEICHIYKIRRRRVASIIDTFSCIIQGILPYGAQIMIAVAFCNSANLDISAFQIIPLCFYQYILLVFVVFFIVTGLADKKPSWSSLQIKSKFFHTSKKEEK